MTETAAREERADEARLERMRLAHDLRNPLAVAVARVQMLRRRLRRGELSPAPTAAELDGIEAALARLRAQIDRFDRDAAHDRAP